MKNNRFKKTVPGICVILAAGFLSAAGTGTHSPESLNSRWQKAVKMTRRYSGENTGFICFSFTGKKQDCCNRNQKAGCTSLKEILNLKEDEADNRRIFFVFSYSSDKESGRSGYYTMTPSKADTFFNTPTAPLYYLGNFSIRESFEQIRRLFLVSKNHDNSKKLLLSAALHPNSEQVVPFLIRQVRQNRNPEIRGKAVFWLGLHPTEDAVRFLKSMLLTYNEKSMQSRAVESLGLNSHCSSTAVLLEMARKQPDSPFYSQTLFWLSQKARHKLGAVKKNADLFHEKNAHALSLAAVQALGQLCRPSSAAKLAELAQTTSLNHRLRSQALFWLAQNHGHEALGILEKILKDDPASNN